MTAFTTHLSLGQIAFGVQAYTPCDYHVVELTVGQIRTYTTDPRVRPESETDPLFKEEYMCVETGIGSGSLWQYGKNIFAIKADAEAAVVVHHQRAHKQRAERDAFQAQQKAEKEARERAEFARLQQKFGSAA